MKRRSFFSALSALATMLCFWKVKSAKSNPLPKSLQQNFKPGRLYKAIDKGTISMEYKAAGTKVIDGVEYIDLGEVISVQFIIEEFNPNIPLAAHEKQVQIVTEGKVYTGDFHSMAAELRHVSK